MNNDARPTRRNAALNVDILAGLNRRSMRLFLGVSMSYIVYICIYFYIHLYTCPILYIPVYSVYAIYTGVHASIVMYTYGVYTCI